MKLDKLANKRIFDFIITRTGVADKENDIVPSAEIEEALDGWLLRGAPISDLHSNRIVGKGMRFWKGEAGTIYGRALIHDDSVIADEVWKKIREGEYGSVSIGGAAFDKSPNALGGQNLNGLEIMEVAVCPSGMHQDANILSSNELAKSIVDPQKAFILKADISPLVQKPLTGSANVEGENDISQFVTLEKQKNIGGILMENKEVKKETPEATPAAPGGNTMDAIMQALQALSAKVDALAQAGAAPKMDYGAPVAPIQKDVDGKAPLNPANGAKVEPDQLYMDRVAPPIGQGKEQGVGKAEIRALVQSEIEEFKKSMHVVSTPLPAVERTVAKAAPSYPALEVARGTKKLSDFVKSNETARLEREVAKRKEFESFQKAQKAVN